MICSNDLEGHYLLSFDVLDGRGVSFTEEIERFTEAKCDLLMIGPYGSLSVCTKLKINRGPNIHTLTVTPHTTMVDGEECSVVKMEGDKQVRYLAYMANNGLVEICFFGLGMATTSFDYVEEALRCFDPSIGEGVVVGKDFSLTQIVNAGVPWFLQISSMPRRRELVARNKTDAMALWLTQ